MMLAPVITLAPVMMLAPVQVNYLLPTRSFVSHMSSSLLHHESLRAREKSHLLLNARLRQLNAVKLDLDEVIFHVTFYIFLCIFTFTDKTITSLPDILLVWRQEVHLSRCSSCQWFSWRHCRPDFP